MHPIIKQSLFTGDSKRRAGEVWTRITTDAVSKNVKYLFHHGGTWFAICEGGSYRSTDRITWVSCGVAGSRMIVLGNALIFYDPSGSTYTRTTDLGVTTTTHSFPGQGYTDSGDIFSDTGAIYFVIESSYESHSIYVTTDGVSWYLSWGGTQYSLSSYGRGKKIQFFAGFAFFVGGDATNSSLYRTDNDGVSWVAARSLISTSFANATLDVLGGYLYVTTENGAESAAFRTQDGLNFVAFDDTNWANGQVIGATVKTTPSYLDIEVQARESMNASNDAIWYRYSTNASFPSNTNSFSTIAGDFFASSESLIDINEVGPGNLYLRTTGAVYLFSLSPSARWLSQSKTLPIVSGGGVVTLNGTSAVVFDGSFCIYQKNNRLIRFVPGASSSASLIPDVVLASPAGYLYSDLKSFAWDGTRYLAYCRFAVYNASTKVYDVTYGFMESAGD